MGTSARVAPYRQPDAQRTAEIAAESERERLAVDAQVREMKSVLRGLSLEVPRGVARAALIVAAVALVVPVACAALGFVFNGSTTARMIFAVAAFVVGIGAGLVAIGLACVALVRERSAPLASVFTVMVGIFALPFSAYCAVVASMAWS